LVFGEIISSIFDVLKEFFHYTIQFYFVNFFLIKNLIDKAVA